MAREVLCDKCQAIRFGELGAHGLQFGTSTSQVYVLHASRASFQQSVAAGCRFCLLLRGQLGTAERVNPPLCERVGGYIVLRLTSVDPAIESHGFQGISATVISKLGVAVLDEIDELPAAYDVVMNGLIYTRGLPRALHQTGSSSSQERQLMPDTGITSLANLSLAQLWIANCIENHPMCALGRTTTSRDSLPTRVIDVSDLKRPYLRETRGALSPNAYVALSYCWGRGKRVLTLKSTLSAHSYDLRIANLPKTFRDAIYVTNGLGYKYLWIDALCMVQDDDGEMSLEMAHMGDIYRQALFTISTEGSSSSNAGVLRQRDWRKYRPCKIRMTFATSENSDGEIARDVTLTGSFNGKNYLKDRGWILQEEVLSSRCLTFGEQMGWRCTSSKAQETRPVPQARADPFQDGYADEIDRMRMWLYATDRMAACARHFRPRSNHFDTWYAMVEQYSDKNLSFVSDTIRALSGLASMFSRGHGTTYLAGLWKEDLLRGLEWYVAYNDPREVLCPKDRQKAPSWSWASVGKVRIRYISQPDIDDTDKTDLAEVVEAFCSSDDPLKDTVRRPRWGLTLRGSLRRATIEFSSKYSDWRTRQTLGAIAHGVDAEYSFIPTRRIHPRFSAALLDTENLEMIIGDASIDASVEAYLESGAMSSSDLTLDSRGHPTGRMPVWYLPLRKLCQGTEVTITGLILLSLGPVPSLYSRIGVSIQHHNDGAMNEVGDLGVTECEVI